MVLVVSNELESNVIDHLIKQGIPSWTIGRVVSDKKGGVTLKHLDSAFHPANLKHLRRPRINVGILISGAGRL